MSVPEFREELRRRALAAGVSASGDLIARLEEYFRLLTVWSDRINLTGLDLRTATPEALDRLLVEPLVAARYAPADAREHIDIGSGGGSPAIPFALALPRTHLRMVESKTRKCVFLREALRATGMADRGEVIPARAEDLASMAGLVATQDLVTIRAVRVDEALLRDVLPLLRAGGELFLFRRNTDSGLDTGSQVWPLEWKTTHHLLESLDSELVVLIKRARGNESRGAAP